jgi:hypothetical protein
MQETTTLKDYKRIALLFGPKAIEFIDQKIKESPNGEDEIVIAAESQMLYLLATLGTQHDTTG